MLANVCFVAVALVLCTQSVTSLQCYECNSNIDKACMDDIPPDSLKKDCSDQQEGPMYTLCRKIVQHIEFEVNGLPPDHRIIRSCGWEDSSYKDRCYQRGGFGGRQEVCSCTTDFCNSAPRSMLGASLLTVVVLALLRTLLY